MSPFVESPEGRLNGRSVFLSASVPSPARAERYRRVDDAHLEIEEAVVSLARAVFTEGGTLVFGGHPAISPLVAMVAGEYITPRMPRHINGRGETAATPIQIYQSRAFEGFLPDETLMMFRAGYATLHWMDAVNGERFELGASRNQPVCPRSLQHMREQMIRETSPVAMVCIGGMEGVEREVEAFREIRRDAPVYVFGETGGASALLAEERGNDGFRVIDREVLARLEPLRRSREWETEKPLIPYPLITQMLVDELIHLDDLSWR